MEEELKGMLEEVIKSEIVNMSSLPPGKERSAAVDDITKLYRVKIDEYKAEADYSEKYQSRIFETERLKEESGKQAETAKTDKIFGYIKLGIEISAVIVPVIFYGVWMSKGLKFEETGTFTSTAFRTLFGKFKPTR